MDHWVRGVASGHTDPSIVFQNFASGFIEPVTSGGFTIKLNLKMRVMVNFLCQSDQVILLRYLVKYFSACFYEDVFG